MFGSGLIGKICEAMGEPLSPELRLHNFMETHKDEIQDVQDNVGEFFGTVIDKAEQGFDSMIDKAGDIIEALL